MEYLDSKYQELMDGGGIDYGDGHGNMQHQMQQEQDNQKGVFEQGWDKLRGAFWR